MRIIFLFPLIAAAVLGVPGAAAAQANREALQLYQKGRQLVDKEPQAAIEALQSAFEKDAVLGRKGGDLESVPYCPPLYLGLAYVALRNPDKAEENLKAAEACRPFLDSAGLKRLADARVRIARGREIAAGVKAGNEAIAARRWPDAITRLEALKKIDADEYAKQNVQALVAGARREWLGELLPRVGALIDKKSLGEAETALADAEKVLGPAPEFRDPRSRIRGIRDEDARIEAYRRAKAAGDGLASSDRAKARAAYDQLQRTYPDLAKTDNVAGTIAALDRGLALTAAMGKAKEGIAARQWSGARTVLLQVLKDEPGNKEATDLLARAESMLTCEQGRQAADQGRYDEAEARFGEAAKRDPTNADARDLLAAAASFRQDAAQAAKLDRLCGAEELRKTLARLAQLDSRRFEREGLAKFAPAPPPRPGEIPQELKGVFDSLQKADTRGAMTEIERFTRTCPQNWPAYIHAYVGAGAEWVAVQLDIDGNAAESRRWTERAKQFFVSALKMDPKQALTAKMLPPPVTDLFNQVRSQR